MRLRVQTFRLFLVAPALVILAASGAARAQEPEVRMPVDPPRFPVSIDEISAPRLPPPFSMPELSHPDLNVALGWMVGSASAASPVAGATGASPAGGGARSSPSLALARATIEGDVLLPRRLYVAALVPFASALSPDAATGAKTVLGNIEGTVRIVFPLPSWLAFGAGLAVVAPTARYERGSGTHAAAEQAASMEPTDAVHFTPDAFALRPAMDMRVLRGPLVVQARQGIDVVLDTEGGRAVTVGRFLGHVGFRVASTVELSVEATQAYLFDERVADRRRTAMTVGPGARWSLGPVDVGAALMTSLFDPLSPTIDRFLAARISLIAHIE